MGRVERFCRPTSLSIVMRRLSWKEIIAILILGALVLSGCFSRPGAPLAQNPSISGGLAELVVEKLGPVVALPNQPFPAELRIKNLGRETLIDVEVVLDLPAGLEVVNAVPSVTGPGLFWRFDRLGPGEILHIRLTMRGPAGEFPNAVRVRAAKLVTAEATGVVVLSAISGITAFLTDEPGVVPVGAPVTYILVLKGQGYGKVQGVTVEIKIPEGMRLKAVEALVKHALDGDTLSFEPFFLAAGDEACLTFTLVAEQTGDMVVRAVVGYQGFQHRLVLEEGTVVYGP